MRNHLCVTVALGREENLIPKAGAAVHCPRRSFSTSMPLTPGLHDLLWDRPAHCRILRDIPGFSPTGYQEHPPRMTTENVCRHTGPPETEITPGWEPLA